MRSLKRLKKSTPTTTIAPRNQSDLQKPDFMPPPPSYAAISILKNSGLSAIFAVKYKLRQIFSRAGASLARKFYKARRLGAEDGPGLDLAGGHELTGGDL